MTVRRRRPRHWMLHEGYSTLVGPVGRSLNYGTTPANSLNTIRAHYSDRLTSVAALDRAVGYRRDEGQLEEDGLMRRTPRFWACARD